MPAFYPFPSLTLDHAESRRRFCRNAQEMLLWFAGENGLITGVSSLECTVIEIPLHSRSNFPPGKYDCVAAFHESAHHKLN
jgi:hypothetical protein